MDEKTCERLEELKKNFPNNYSNVIRVLRFIYHTAIDESINSKINKLEIEYDIYKTSNRNGYTSCYDDICKLRDRKAMIFRELVNPFKGIKDLLFEIVEDESKEFANYFFKKIDIPLDLFENQIFSETDPSFYMYNIFAMLKAYKGNKNDFEKFKLMVDDIVFTFANSNEKENNRYKTTIVTQIINCSYYENGNLLQTLLKRVIKEFNKEYSGKEVTRLNKMFDYLRNLEYDANRYRRSGYQIPEETEKTISNDIMLLVHRDLLTSSIPFYEEILLFGDRYNCLKKELERINFQYREEVQSYFSKLSVSMFEELNFGRQTDSFDDCIKIIFDSDTYSELLSKLNSLKEANKEYKDGNKKRAFELLRELNSDKHKEKFGDVVVSYSTNSINKPEKPRRIEERMKELYNKNDLLPKNWQWDMNKDKTILELTSTIKEKIVEHETNKSLVASSITQKPEESASVKKKSKFPFFINNN